MDGPALGLRIRNARKRLRMTQDQLASAVGVHKTTVRNWESGRTSPEGALPRLEDVLGIDLGSGSFQSQSQGPATAQVLTANDAIPAGLEVVRQARYFGELCDRAGLTYEVAYGPWEAAVQAVYQLMARMTGPESSGSHRPPDAAEPVDSDSRMSSDTPARRESETREEIGALLPSDAPAPTGDDDEQRPSPDPPPDELRRTAERELQRLAEATASADALAANRERGGGSEAAGSLNAPPEHVAGHTAPQGGETPS